MWDGDSLLVQEAKSCDEKLAVELQQLEELDINIFMDDCGRLHGQRATFQQLLMGWGHSLFSVLMRAVSILPFSSRSAMSRREALAWAFFFS